MDKKTSAFPGDKFREAESRDIAEIVRIHQSAFPEFFMTLLGQDFLKQYYLLVLAFSGKIFIVKDGEKTIEGFVCGFLTPSKFYINMHKNRRRLLVSMLKQLCLKPYLILRLIASYSMANNSSQCKQLDVCELSSIAVDPVLKGKGVGKGLIQAFVTATMGRAHSIVLTTDADGNDSVNAFYQSFGFIIEASSERSKGRRMNCYRLMIESKSEDGPEG